MKELPLGSRPSLILLRAFHPWPTALRGIPSFWVFPDNKIWAATLCLYSRAQSLEVDPPVCLQGHFPIGDAPISQAANPWLPSQPDHLLQGVIRPNLQQRRFMHKSRTNPR